MRFSDAGGLVRELDGVQTHRPWWVNAGYVREEVPGVVERVLRGPGRLGRLPRPATCILPAHFAAPMAGRIVSARDRWRFAFAERSPEVSGEVCSQSGEAGAKTASEAGRL
jgi:hypothetical protein